MRPAGWLILALSALLLAIAGRWLSADPAADEGARDPSLLAAPDGVGSPGGSTSPSSSTGRPGTSHSTSGDAAAAAAAAELAAKALSDAVAMRELRGSIDGAGVDFDFLDSFFGDPEREALSAERGATRCDPSPCVTSFSYDMGAEGAGDFQNALLMVAMEAGQEAGQPTMSWEDPEGSESVRKGWLWYVPHEATPAEAEALRLNAEAHRLAMGGSPG